MGLSLYDHQIEAIEKLRNGSILCGGVGTGKSRTAIAYYFLKVCGGNIAINGQGSWGDMTSPLDLYIITTAKKRDSLEWQGECVPFLLVSDKDGKPVPDQSASHVNVTIDSWNNIKKYTKVFGAFFIFDEQRVVGKGSWVKSFLNITRKNKWILLSATPGDTWSDYIPVFIANGFYKNRSDFSSKHIVYKPYMKYPAIDHYVNTGRLIQLRNYILVKMEYQRKTIQHHLTVIAEYNKPAYQRVWRDRWDVFDEEPIQETGKLFYLMRKVVNFDPRRRDAVEEILKKYDRAIIFYNFDYELLTLRDMGKLCNYEVGEWNGWKHDDLPKSKRWLYLVQYMAGAEGWNCTETNVVIFYSLNYSYRLTVQAEGRIDRLNTPYTDLYYYHVRSHAPIDLAIQRALKNKQNFNERSFAGV